jgi:UDP-GlcNAc:undecaprenyl-phosphate GlcNAc-1-phosphate transferase
MNWTPLVLLLGAALVAWGLTLLSEHLGKALKLVDSPGGPLKIHQRETPRFGGFAIVVSLWLVHFAGKALGLSSFSQSELFIATLLFALGTWDDFKPRPAAVRLILQVMIFVFSWKLGIRVDFTGSALLDTGLAFGLFIVVINAVNFFDGMDGLLALVAACAFSVWSVVAADAGSAWLANAFAAAILLGFLPRNWHPARTFLGDGGSFVVGFLFYLVFVRSEALGPDRLAGFWVAAVPVCDAVAATLDRLSRHGNVFAGDRDHVYDILNRLGLAAPQVALALGLAAAIAARGTAYMLTRSFLEAAVLTVVLYVILISLILALRRRFRLEPDHHNGHGVPR